MITFPDWLENELKKRKWKPADLARNSNLSRTAISNILNDSRNARADTCTKIAKAFGIPQEEVFRAAGLLKPLAPKSDETIDKIIYTVTQASPKLREEILEYALWKLEREKK